MPRRPRVIAESGIYHVMNRGTDHQAVFFDDRDRVAFGVQLADIHERFGIRTLAYCLMGNHYHLLLRAGAGTLSGAMQHLGSRYTAHVNERLDRDGPLFRGRFHAVAVESEPYLLWAARYVHRNPVDIVGARDLASYRWSSYRSYLGLRRCPAFVDTETVMSRFDHDPRQLRAFTESDDARHPVGTVAEVVDFAIGEGELTVSGDESALGWRRSILVLLEASDLPPAFRADVDRLRTFTSESARRQAVWRARRRFASDPAFRHVVDVVGQRLRVTIRV